MNRYYAPQWGRFTTPDPYQASAQLANPQSWNRYSYVENDPVNKYDPGGLCALWVDSPEGPVHYNLNCWVDRGHGESAAVTTDEALPQGHPASEGSPYDLGRAPGGKLARAGVSSKPCQDALRKLGAGTGSDIVGKFDQTKFQYSNDKGLPVAIRTPEGLRGTDRMNLAWEDGGTVYLNGFVPFLTDLNFTPVQVRGEARWDIFRFVDALAINLGVDITNERAKALLVVHEFAHTLGIKHQPGLNADLFKHCIQGVVFP
jgi:hypothetical protein